MYVDFHTHGKLAKYLPFSTEYTDWLLNEAKCAGLDAICLTEHFNTQQFELLYRYIATQGTCQGDAYVFDGLKIFPGMETDIAEGGHVLSIGPMEAILELNHRLEPHKAKGSFLPAAELLELFGEYPVLVGAGIQIHRRTYPWSAVDSKPGTNVNCNGSGVPRNGEG